MECYDLKSTITRDLTQTTTAAKTSQNKGFNEWYNGTARVINLRTFLSTPLKNKEKLKKQKKEKKATEHILLMELNDFLAYASIYRRQVARL